MLIIWKQERMSVSGCLVVHHSPNHKEGQTEQVRMKQKEIRLMDLVKSADVAVLTEGRFWKANLEQCRWSVCTVSSYTLLFTLLAAGNYGTCLFCSKCAVQTLILKKNHCIKTAWTHPVWVGGSDTQRSAYGNVKIWSHWRYNLQQEVMTSGCCVIAHRHIASLYFTRSEASLHQAGVCLYNIDDIIMSSQNETTNTGAKSLQTPDQVGTTRFWFVFGV